MLNAIKGRTSDADASHKSRRYHPKLELCQMSLLKKRSLAQPQTRISAKRVAEILGCAERTVFNGGAGTNQLTRIRNGSRQLRFLEVEVIALALQQEEIFRPSQR